MKTIIISTQNKDQVVDITENVQDEIKKENAKDGICHLFVLHTTCALTTADLDPGTDLDLLDALRSVLPKIHYRHPHDPSHVPDHILSSIIGPSITIPIENGEFVLGTWQRVILLEFDGPRERKIVVTILGEASGGKG